MKNGETKDENWKEEYMKIIAKILSIAMLISMISVPIYAEATTTDEMIEHFVDNLLAMSESQRDAYFDLLKLIIDLDDSDGLTTAYNNAMNSMAGGQEDKLVAMKKVLDNLDEISTGVLDGSFDYATFKAYVIAKNKTDLLSELIERRDAVEYALDGINIATMDLGFDRMQQIFDLQSLAGLIGKSFILITQQANGSVYVYEDGIVEIVRLANNVSNITISSVDSLRTGAQQLANYYNGSSQSSILYTYFYKYGIIKVDSTFVVPGTGTGTGTGTNTGTVPVTLEEDLGTDAIVPEGTALFGDIGRFTWAWTAIRQLYIAEVIKGKSETEFDPSGYITRAEFAALLTRLLETNIPLDTPTLESIFDDVNSNKWYYKEVMSAFKAGYVNGIGIGEFNPTSNINREQIATILARVLKDRGLEAIDSNEIDTILNQFSDSTTVSPWAKAGSAMIADLGIINGVTMDNKKYFNFKENATRAEVAVMLYRLTELIETKVVVK